jgi:hypothetical protein
MRFTKKNIPNVSLDFSVTYFLPTAPWPEVDLVPSENDYQELSWGKGSLCVRLTSLHSYAEYHGNLES